MASLAYRPEQTQAPYRSWNLFSRDDSLQADQRVVDDVVSVLEFRWPTPVALKTQPEPIIRTDFKESYRQWLEDSLFDSLPDRMRRYQSYQRIVAMGDRVVPLIAAELRQEPSFLFLALEEITETNPVPKSATGNLKQTVDAWLSWLRR
jgi:hypothetical protein